MTIRAHLFAAAAASAAVSVPAAAQTAYPYSNQQQTAPQPYPGQPGYGFVQQSDPRYSQGYAHDPMSQIISSLLGNRYNVTDRQAVSQCASAAMAKARRQYGNSNNQNYANSGYNEHDNRAYGDNGYGRAYNNPMRVTSITDVQRRNNGLRVSGLMSSGYTSRYGNQYAYQNRGFGEGNAPSNVSFRCNVDYRGQITNVRIGRNRAY